MSPEQKADLIQRIVDNLQTEATLQGKEFNEFKTFFSLAFKTEEELKEIYNLLVGFIIEDKCKRQVFKDYRNKIIEITHHYEGCKYKGSEVPVRACVCNCYEKQIFNMGMEALEKLFYGGSDK